MRKDQPGSILSEQTAAQSGRHRQVLQLLFQLEGSQLPLGQRLLGAIAASFIFTTHNLQLLCTVVALPWFAVQIKKDGLQLACTTLLLSSTQPQLACPAQVADASSSAGMRDDMVTTIRLRTQHPHELSRLPHQGMERQPAASGWQRQHSE